MSLAWYEKQEWMSKTRHLNHITFACYGNTCRSPSAEFFGRTITHWWDGLTIESRGVITTEEDLRFAAPEVIKVIGTKLSKILEKHKARKMSRRDMERTDLVLTMTVKVRDTLKAEFPDLAYKIFTLIGFVQEKEQMPLANIDIENPFLPPDVRKAKKIFPGSISYYHYIQNYARIIMLIRKYVRSLIVILYRLKRAEKI